MSPDRLYAATTRVPVAQTRAEIERLLGKHKARQFGTAVDFDRRCARVQFRLNDRIVRFEVELPDPKKFWGTAKLEQAERQKWRALLLVIKAKLEAVENKISSFEQEFLAYVVLPTDQTVADVVIPLINEAYGGGRMPRALLPAATGDK